MTDETWNDDEVITYLKELRTAIDEGLANIGADDDVEGFALGTSFQISAPLASPDLVARLGPRFSATFSDAAASNGQCGIICGAPMRPGGGAISR